MTIIRRKTIDTAAADACPRKILSLTQQKGFQVAMATMAPQTMAARKGITTANAAAMTTSTKMTMAAGPMYFVTEKLDMD